MYACVEMKASVAANPVRLMRIRSPDLVLIPECVLDPGIFSIQIPMTNESPSNVGFIIERVLKLWLWQPVSFRSDSTNSALDVMGIVGYVFAPRLI